MPFLACLQMVIPAGSTQLTFLAYLHEVIFGLINYLKINNKLMKGKTQIQLQT